MAEYAELEIGLKRQGGDSFAVDLRFSLPDSDAERRGTAEGHHLALEELRLLVHDPAAYGRRLGQDVFRFPDVREALAVVKSRGLDLRFRLALAPNDTELHGLRWETLADPNAPPPGAPLLMSERVLFSRYVDSGDWRPVTPRTKSDLRALVVVANPSDLDRYRLAPVDVAGEIIRARNGMTGITTIDVLGESDRASMKNIRDLLRTGPDILYLVCHGALVDGTSALWLEHDDGTADRRDGQEVVSWLGELKHPPRLVVLVSCQSAGTGANPAANATVTAREEAWTALGPRLGASGVPAVVAMQGNVTMTTVEAFMPVFFHELQTDGIVDRAVAVARGAVRDRPDAWAPVLYMRLKSGRLWSQPPPIEFAAGPSPDRPTHNLPAPPTPLISRETELATLRQMLTAPDARLITLTGPGGIGKTRLAVQAASELLEVFPDGVWWVSLAAISDPALVVQAIATPLGVREVSGEPLLETLGEHLRARQTLLLLDNLEQVIEAAPLVARLLEVALDLHVLATSRAPLRLRAEHEVPVAPLSLPPATPGRVSLEAAQGSPAVQLFLERAQAVKPGFTLEAGNAATIAAICHRLDGLPLAIELAAARVRVLPPEQLLGRLDQRLKLLTGGSRDLPARQQTLRATVSWSHDLLEPAEQALFTRLAVFAGGCTLEAAKAVCDAAGELGIDVLDGLDSLTQKSLLRQEEGPGSEPRFTMFETIREYGLDRLAQSGEGDEVATRHAAYFLDLGERASPALAGAEQADWLDLLALEHDNVRAAFDHFEERRAGTESVRLAGALWHFWWIRGHLSEGRDRLQRALETGDCDAVPAAIRASALDGAGALAEAQGDIARAVILHEEALLLWQKVGDRLGQARSLENLGLIELHDRGNAPRAREYFEAALALHRQEGDQQGIATVLRNLGDAALAEEHFAEAARLYDDALFHARPLGNIRVIAASLTSLGTLAFFQGDHARAISLYEESLPLWRQLDDVPGTALALGNLGEALDHAGDVTRAKTLYSESLALASSLGDRQGVAFAQSHLGRIARQEGDAQLAATLFTQSAQISQEIEDDARLAESLEGLAGALADLGETAEAARLFGAASALREQTESLLLAVHRPTYERDLCAVRAALGSDHLASLLTEGATIPAAEIPALLANWRSRFSEKEPAVPVVATTR